MPLSFLGINLVLKNINERIALNDLSGFRMNYLWLSHNVICMLQGKRVNIGSFR
jgi:hypothetical protein